MGMIENLMGTGVPAETAAKIAIWDVTSAPALNISAAGLTAAGSTITDALQLTGFYSSIGVVTAGQGVKLPQAWPIGQIGIVYNGDAADALNLYPPDATHTFAGKTAGQAVTIAAAASNLIIKTGALTWNTYVLAFEA